MMFPLEVESIHAQVVANGGRIGNGKIFAALLALLHGHGAFADALAKIVKLGPARPAFALHSHLLDVGTVDGKNALDTLAVADAAHGEGGIQAT